MWYSCGGCEAQDCEPEAFLAGECTGGAPQILEAYNAKRGPLDPFMPCVKVPCPCYDDEDLAALRETYPMSLVISGVSDTYIKDGDIFFSPGKGLLAAALETTEAAELPYYCGLLKSDGTMGFQGIVEQQYEDCSQVLLDFAKAAGIPRFCVPAGPCPEE